MFLEALVITTEEFAMSQRLRCAIANIKTSVHSQVTQIRTVAVAKTQSSTGCKGSTHHLAMDSTSTGSANAWQMLLNQKKLAVLVNNSGLFLDEETFYHQEMLRHLLV